LLKVLQPAQELWWRNIARCLHFANQCQYAFDLFWKLYRVEQSSRPLTADRMSVRSGQRSGFGVRQNRRSQSHDRLFTVLKNARLKPNSPGFGFFTVSITDRSCALPH